ncbi:phage portal protein, partial [Mesorhizobium sp. M7A.F.Ca.ET.027.03.2.1]|uniref:phage portal protein n=1 Tax=Mesorhizobium sp. M7A.F.Ca.ET.027.03.2.1 TaxID=2496656 RepID=UPI000FCA5EF8
FDTLSIDADGNTNLYGLQALAVGAMFEGGDCIIRRRYRFTADGFALPFQLQVLEAEYLDDYKTGPLPGGNTVIQGVEFDQIGRRVAYWLFDQHPSGLAMLRNFQSRRIDAKDIIHLFRIDRPGQVRGVPWLAPVIVTLNDFAEFKDAQLVRQKIAACFAAFIHDPDFEGDTPQPQGGEGKPEREIDELGPGMIETLPVGKTVSFSDPPELGEFSAYSDATGRDIAVGVGITFESLTGNLSNVNFTSGRMGRIDMDANVDAWRWLVVIPKLCVL